MVLIYRESDELFELIAENPEEEIVLRKMWINGIQRCSYFTPDDDNHSLAIKPEIEQG